MSRPQPLVDVLISSFNPRASLVTRAIESILAQTFTDWNLHIINDGSSLNFNELLKDIKDPRIFYYNRPHQGKAAALNFGLTMCTGKFLAYLDDDDIWYPNHLELAVSFLQEKRLQFVHTDSLSIFLEQKNGIWQEVRRAILHHGFVSDKTLNHVGHITVVHDRALIELAGTYDETRPFFIDWDFLLRIAKHCIPTHLPIVTCENYYYLGEMGLLKNPVSSLHKNHPELSKESAKNLFSRAFEFINADDFAELAQELVDSISMNRELLWQVSELKRQLSEGGNLNNEKELFIKKERPSILEFPNKESSFFFHGGWQPQTPGENYRWINRKASVELSFPQNAKSLYLEGYLPETFIEVTKVKIYLNEILFDLAELTPGNPFLIEKPLPDGLLPASVIYLGIEFDGVHCPSQNSQDQRELSALIMKIAII